MKTPQDKQHFVPKGWGYEVWIVNDEQHNYCGKLLHFKEGKECSWHVHKIKDEVFYVHAGKLKVIWSDDEHVLPTSAEANVEILHKGESIHIPPNRLHMMRGLQETYLYEFSTYHTEEDSIRVIKGD